MSLTLRYSWPAVGIIVLTAIVLLRFASRPTSNHSNVQNEPFGNVKAKFELDFSKTYDVCTVGAGLSGVILAERYAKVLRKRVLVLDSRDHIGGNYYDFIDQSTGILRGKYGAHFFHSNDERAWHYINLHPNAPKWLRWQHEVRGWVQGRLLPIPVNAYTVNALFNLSVQTESEMNEWLAKVQIPCPEGGCKTAEQLIKSRVGEELFKLIFQDYTVKQWGKEPDELIPAVVDRIPVYTAFNPRYFTEKHQVLPSEGYTAWFAALLDDASIDVVLNTDFFDHREHLEEACSLVVYTGLIDSYFSDSGLEKLAYRSVEFVEKRFYHVGYVQPVAVINYLSEDNQFTRSVEYRHFLNQEHTPHSIVVSEKPMEEGEPYYPVRSPQNLQLYAKYKSLAQKAEESGSVVFAGPLAMYKHLAMDEEIISALQIFYTKENAENSPSFAKLMSVTSTKSSAASFVPSPAPSTPKPVLHCQIPKWVGLISRPERTHTWTVGTTSGVCYGLRKDAIFAPARIKAFAKSGKTVNKARVAILLRGYFGSTDKNAVAKGNLQALLKFFPKAKVFIHSWTERVASVHSEKGSVNSTVIANYYDIPKANHGGIIVDPAVQILARLKGLYTESELSGTVCENINVPSLTQNLAWLQTWWSILQASALVMKNHANFDAVLNVRHDTYEKYRTVTKDWTVLCDLAKKYLKLSKQAPTDSSCWLYRQGSNNMLGSESAFATGLRSNYILATKWVYHYRAMVEAFCQSNPYAYEGRLAPISASLLL